MDRTTGFLNEAMETQSWEAQQRALSRRLRETVAHAYEHAPYWRRVMDEAGVSPSDIQGVADLPKLPVTPKAKLVEIQGAQPPFGGLLGMAVERMQRMFRSPGPIYDPQGPGEGWGWEEALFAAGFRPGDISINTFSYHMTPAGMMFDDALRTLGCPVVPTGVGEREAQVEIMQRLGVKGFVGMASFLLQIGEKAKELGVDPRRDLGLEVAFVTAEPLPDSLRSSVEEMFGLILRQGYGTADCGCIAYECFHKGGMHVVNRAVVEIVDPTTGQPVPEGETGEVVVTLFHKAYPLLRFGTGDLSAFQPGGCACGRATPKLKGWLGRADQLVKVKGMFVHPGQLQAVFREFPEVGGFRAVVSRENNRDRLTVRVVSRERSEGLAQKIAGRLRDVLRIGVEVEWVDGLPGDGKVVEDTRTWD